MEGSESTVNGRVSMPWAARVVREEGLRAVAKTRRLWEWKARAREWPIPPGEQLGRMLARRRGCGLRIHDEVVERIQHRSPSTDIGGKVEESCTPALPSITFRAEMKGWY